MRNILDAIVFFLFIYISLSFGVFVGNYIETKSNKKDTQSEILSDNVKKEKEYSFNLIDVSLYGVYAVRDSAHFNCSFYIRNHMEYHVLDSLTLEISAKRKNHSFNQIKTIKTKADCCNEFKVGFINIPFYIPNPSFRLKQIYIKEKK